MEKEALEELITEIKDKIEVEIAEVLDKHLEPLYDLCDSEEEE